MDKSPLAVALRKGAKMSSSTIKKLISLPCSPPRVEQMSSEAGGATIWPQEEMGTWNQNWNLGQTELSLWAVSRT